MLLSMLRFFVVHVIIVVWSFTATTTTTTSVQASSALAPSEVPSIAPSGPTAIKSSSSAPSTTTVSLSDYIDPTGNNTICNICTNGTAANDGSDITEPNVTISYGTLTITCLELYNDGLAGQIKDGLCLSIRDPTVVDIIVLCGCTGPNTDGPTETPTKLLSLFPSISPHVTAIPSVTPSTTSNNNNIKSPTSSAATATSNNYVSRMVITSFWTVLVMAATYVTTSANY